MEKEIIEENLFIKMIKKLIRENKQFFAMCSGKLGSGKSISMLSIGEVLNYTLTGKEFDISQVCFTLLDLLRNLNKRPKLPRGSVILADEIQLSGDAQRFMTDEVQDMQKILTTCRYRGYVILSTLPERGQLAKRGRTVADGFFKTTGRMVQRKYAVLRYYNIQRNPEQNKDYTKVLKGVDNKGRIINYEDMVVMYPSKELARQYDRKKTQFTDDMYLTMQKTIEFKKQANEKNNDDIINEILENKEMYTKTYNNREFIDKNIIMEVHKVGMSRACVIKSKVEGEIEKNNV